MAVAEGPATRLQGHVPVTGGIGLRFWTGGSTHGLVGEAERAGCSALSSYVNRPGGEGGLVTYIPDTRVAAANQPYLEAFPTGHVPATPVLLVCRPHVQGMVYDAEGRPSSGVNNTWYSAGWYGPGGYATIRTDASFIAPGSPEAVDIEIVLPAFRTIAGFILEPDGEGRGDVFVRAFRDSVQLANFTRANGRFAFSMPEGPVRLAFGTGVPSGRGRVVRHFGWYGDGAVTTAPSQASEIDLSGEDVELRLRIPTLRRITGWVRLPDTIDLPEATAPGAVSIRLLSYAADRGEYLTEVLVAEDGRFELAVIDGVYALQLIVHGDYTMTVATYDPVSRVTSACGPPTPFTIETDARAREVTLTQEMIEGRACP